MKRLGLLVIGDEILAGHTQDTNSHWLAKELKQMGIELRRIEVCTDEVDDIVESLHRFLGRLRLDYIVTSGGLGPTHDDRTMEAIAKAIGTDLAITQRNREWMQHRVRQGYERGYFDFAEPNEGHLKMALLPEGADPMPNDLGTCLGAIVEHDGVKLFTLPGVPMEFRRMFQESVAPHLERGEAQHVEELKLYTEESRLFTLMRDVEAKYDDVDLGSYPHRGYILLRATGPEARAKRLLAEIRDAASQYAEPKDA